MQVIKRESLVQLAVESAKLVDIFDEILVSFGDEETLFSSRRAWGKSSSSLQLGVFRQ